ncbi:ABC transporter ATP-binding protein/permease [Christensenellaceae bacterium OttesenSCG-928-K19]|nr:ABC transporter ATP-binding protein/permease [Christensenellaceae bacterium OttesenSCG-928-K19]
MWKIAKYLKPFTLMLLAVVGLLFAQAFAELNLPDYMSDIVNTGIQQGGIEEAAPDAISQNGMQLMTAFMDDSGKELAEQNYTLVQQGDPAYEAEYPGVADTSIYVKKEVDAQTIGDLDNAFGTASWTFINIMREYAPDDAEGAAAEADADEASTSSIDLSQVDMDAVYQMLPMIGQLPQQVVDDARERAAQMPDNMRLQSGAAFAKVFYNELGMDTEQIQSSFIAGKGGMMLVIALVGAAAAIFAGYFSSKIAAGMAKNLRRDLFNKVENFSLNEFNRFSTASLITRTTNDITQVQTFVTMAVRMLLFSPIMGVGGVIMALNKSTSMAWVIGVAVLVIAGLLITVFLVALPKFKIMQKLIDRLNLVARESLSGMLVIRAFGTQKHEEKRFDDANTDLTKTTYFVNKVMMTMMPFMMLVMNCVSLLIVWVGAHQIEASTMQVGDMMAYIQYAMIIIMSFLFIAVIFVMIPRASVSANRISEVLETDLTILDPKDPKPFDTGKMGVVEFKDVSFKYQGAEEDVLCDISFTSNPGEVTAFIGSTGSGKSTLINLIPRFYDVSGGQVLVNGVDVRDVTQHNLRDQIGYVPQKGVLFSGTIASNLRYGAPGASDEEIEHVAEIAQAKDFISRKEEGFDSPIAEGGGNVSGGQKQRLSIARALAKNAPVYIFDDSFSALDFKTDTTLRKALKPYTKDSTVLIVAQRVSTILHADQIIVLDEGRIVGKGTHEELIKDCPTYKEIAESQIGVEQA